mgnify:CR=1 FL=1
MRGHQVLLRTKRNDAGRVDVVVGDIVVPLDVVKLYRLGDPRLLVEIPQIRCQVRVVDEASQVALEVTVINGVKADQGHEQPPIRLRYHLAHQIATTRQAGLQQVERLKQPGHPAVVGSLCAGKATAVDAVVHVGVDDLVDRVDLGTQLLGVIVEIIASPRVEFAIQHADDLGRLVVHDRLAFLVPEHRDCETC